MAADGHEYAVQALDNGAAVFIAQKELALPDGIPVVRTSDTERHWRMFPINFTGIYQVPG